MEIDYSQYSLEDLYDVERNIDATAHPAKYRQVLEQISIKRTEATSAEYTPNELTGYSSFMQDSIALKTSWEPLVNGGSNFATHVLDDSSHSKVRIKPSIGLYLFTLFFGGTSFTAFSKMDNVLIDKGE